MVIGLPPRHPKPANVAKRQHAAPVRPQLALDELDVEQLPAAAEVACEHQQGRAQSRKLDALDISKASMHAARIVVVRAAPQSGALPDAEGSAAEGCTQRVVLWTLGSGQQQRGGFQFICRVQLHESGECAHPQMALSFALRFEVKAARGPND